MSFKWWLLWVMVILWAQNIYTLRLGNGKSIDQEHSDREWRRILTFATVIFLLVVLARGWETIH